MQRQSLGSPVSKLHIHGGLPNEDSLVTQPDDDDDNKTSKPSRGLSLSPPPSSLSSSTHSKPDKFIHLIPLLTLFCFLILYLSSHSPSQSDLEHINGFNRPANHKDSSEFEDVGRFIDLRRGDVLAVRSLRNLREVERQAPKSRPPRKIADF